MPADFSGFDAAVDLSYKPRNGQWVKFDLPDPGRHLALVEKGAHAARDGGLVAIFRAAHRTPLVSLTRDGKAVTEGGEALPDMLVLVTPQGHNLSVPVMDPKTGHGSWSDVFFHPASPSVRNLRPLDDLADMPPGRAVHPDWNPAV